MLYLLFFIFFPSFAVGEMLNLDVAAEAALLVNADSGAVLYQKNPRKKMYPASLTKIATALYALKLKGDDLDELIPAEQECIGSVTEEAKQLAHYSQPSYLLVTDSSHMGIKRKEMLTLRDLLYGMMIVSADDAANVIAYALGKGSIPEFMNGLNGLLQSLGCRDTYFNNPHGLYHPEHMTTAYDLAILSCEAMKYPLFRNIVATKKYIRPKTNKQEACALVQTNRLLREGEFFYPKAIGIKTGYISKAGNTLVACAQDGERTLIAVLLNVKERKVLFREATRLFEAAFNQARVERRIICAGPQKFTRELPQLSRPIQTYAAEDVVLSYYPAEEPRIRAFLQWDEIGLPLVKGQRVGEIQLKSPGNRLWKTVSLLAQDDVSLSWIDQAKQWFLVNWGKIALFLAVILGCCLIFRLLRQ
jgi:D-alanyl-D-alanine carboxypeptidase (penicillin-binding protein 5/6)